MFTINKEGYRNQSHARYLKDYTLLKLEEKSFQKIKSSRNKTVSLGLPYKTGSLQLELEPLHLFDGEFKLITDKSKGQALPFKPGTFYRGKIKDDTASMVTLSVFDDEVNGIISSTRFGNLNLGRIQNHQADEYILYNESDAKENISFTCASPTNAIYRSQLEQIQTQIEQQLESRADGCITVDFELTHEVYTQYQNNINNAANWLTTLFAAVKSLYLNEQVNISIKTIFVWTSDDGYSDDVGTALDQLKSRRLNDAAFTANFVHLVRGELCNGGCSLAGIAWLDILCNNSYRFAVSEPLFSYAAYPGYSWSVNVLTHEQGHNIASPHTHWCGWTGGPIDGCASPDGTCTAGPIPTTGGGTIMSYCHQNVGINFANGFGPQPGNRIRARFNAATCLSVNCNDGITIPSGPSSCNDGIQNGGETGIDCGGPCTNICNPNCPSPVNLSQGKTAVTMSSTLSGYPGTRGNDGNMSNFFHTLNELQPWWQIDLGTSQLVTGIEITNRKDCCGNRVKKLRIFVGASPAGSFNEAGYVYNYDNSNGMSNGQVVAIPNLNNIGRYVRIWVDNGSTAAPLHLTEVKVMGCVSTVNPCSNNNPPAIPGVSAAPTYIQNSSVTLNATASDPDNNLARVEFYNGNTLLGSDNSSPYSYTIQTASASSYSITAKAIDQCNEEAASLVVNMVATSDCGDGFQNGSEQGVDCGANGCPVCPQNCSTPVNISQGKIAVTMSTTLSGYPGTRGNDGNLSNFFHTQNELKPWWQIDLESNYLVSTIEITNRKDCCGNRVKKLRVFVGTSPAGSFNDAGYVFNYDNGSGMSNGQVITITDLNKLGRYVQVWVDHGTAAAPLHLTEVKVMGCVSTVNPCLNNNPPAMPGVSAASTYIQNSSVTLNATASDPDNNLARVEFYNGNTLLGSDNSSPYSYTIPTASEVSYSITAKAIDQCNEEAVSAIVNMVATADCSDGYQNGSEQGVDCGTTGCPDCPQNCTAPINISQGKAAVTMSTLLTGYPGTRGNDGNLSNFFHTLNEIKPWWQIDLESNYLVSSVEITNRKDCCGNRIKKLRVFVGTSPAGSFEDAGYVYNYDNGGGMSNGQVVTISDLNKLGRYIRVWVDNGGSAGPLHLTEIKVFGCSVAGSDISVKDNQTGISEIKALKMQVSIFPNPVHEVLNFVYSSPPIEEVKAMLYDLTGRQLLHAVIKDGKLDISRLENGSYFVHVFYHGEHTVKKILKF